MYSEKSTLTTSSHNTFQSALFAFKVAVAYLSKSFNSKCSNQAFSIHKASHPAQANNSILVYFLFLTILSYLINNLVRLYLSLAINQFSLLKLDNNKTKKQHPIALDPAFYRYT